MTIPSATYAVSDPGLGTSQASPSTPLYFGCSSAGTVNTLYTFTRVGDVIATLGQGPLVEALCYYLLVTGGPVMAMRLTGSVAASCGAVTPVRTSTSTGTITVTSQIPYDAYQFVIKITTTGAAGVGAFKYSLDNGVNYSDTITIPSGGTYTVPNTGVAITFVAGAGPIIHEAGDTHTFACVAPYYSTTNLASAVTAKLADTTPFAFAVLIGTAASTSAGATMAAAFAVHMQSFFNVLAYERGIMDAGIDTTATTITSFASYSGTRLAICYGSCTVPSAKPIVGWGNPSQSIVSIVAARAGGVLISTDLARVRDGSLIGVSAVSYDEFVSQQLDQFKFTTLRTWIGRPGFYITNCNLMSAPGSDFQYWQHGRMMDVACDVTQKAQQLFQSQSFRTNPGTGTIDERDAKSAEAEVKAKLREALLDPASAEGTPGHVSALNYTIDRGNNLLATKNINSNVAIEPRGYGKLITTTLGFSANVGG